MSNLKLGVEVVSAHDLTPKEKTDVGLCNVFVELNFDDQKFRTSIKYNDPDPLWNEKFFFNISDPNSLSNLVLQAQVYHKSTNTKSFLGRVRIPGTSFVPISESVVLHFPLEKRSIFSGTARGELGLKVFVTDDPYVHSSDPFLKMEASNGRHRFRAIPTVKESPEKKQSPQRTSKPWQLPQEPPVVEDSRFQPMDQGQKGEKIGVPMPARVLQMNPDLNSQRLEYSIKETRPNLGRGKRAAFHDLVEPMEFLFVRITKARDLPTMDVTGSLDPYVEVKVGNFKGKTKHFEKKRNPEWNEVFAFAKHNLQSNFLEVVVKDKDVVKDDFVGMVQFDLSEVPTRVSPGSAPMAPQWYRLTGEKAKGDIMLVVWYGSQADEAFPDAIYSDAFSAANKSSVRSKIYHSPRLWYVRVNVIEAQDLFVSDRPRLLPDAYVKIQLGNQVLRTRSARAQNLNPKWNEEFMLVAAEPFEDHIIVSVEDRVAVNNDETIGKVVIPLDSVERRADDRVVPSRWFSLEKPSSGAVTDKEQPRKIKFAARLHLNICLDGGYHVLDESTYYSSNFQPTAKQLWKSSIGILEVGFISVEGLVPTKTRDGKGTADTFCVAKYGRKWVRTRTVMDSLSPKFNEQYTWEVYDPATVITVGVFDNNQVDGLNDNSKDGKIGKVRIRISNLESGRIYTNSYPLLVLRTSGVKKMGEIHLAIRFSCMSGMQTVFQYSKPLLPKMHYVKPLTVVQQEILRQHATNVMAARLGRAEPPLRKEVVEYISDAHSHLWSMRKSRASFSRLRSVFSGIIAAGQWFEDICSWRKPSMTVAVHTLYMVFVCVPDKILPMVFVCLFMLGLWNYRLRPRQPPHMDIRLSYAENAHPDELDEEFDTFPTTRDPEVVRMRYDRLRSIAGRAQKVVSDIAAQGERVQSLLSWRDPRATSIFMAFCLASSVVLYAIPFQRIALIAGFYFMRHPKFRRQTPPAPINFFRRLPAKTDCML